MMTSSDANWDQRLNFAVAIAREAGAATLAHFRRADLAIERKADQSPVTIADREAEELLRTRIGRRFPQDAIIGEELGTTQGNSGYEWVLDPIDGTKSFIHGVPLYTTLVALLHDGKPVLGVIHAPAAGETVYASRGQGCWHLAGESSQATRARVSSVPRLAEGLLLTSEVATFSDGRQRDALEVYLRLQSAAQLARTWGDGYGYLLVATGRAEVMIDPQMSLWDAAPLQTVIEEAGGMFTDWSGEPTIRSGEAVATNGLVGEEVLAITRGH